MNFKKLFLIGAIAIAATSAMAQGFRGGGGMNNPAFLLQRDDVKTDLALTDDQKNKLAELRETMRSDMQSARAAAGDDRDAQRKAMQDVFAKVTDSINKILTADQQKRLKEIGLQLSGFSAIANDKDIQTQLALTDDQKSKITDLAKQAGDANRAVFTNQDTQMDEKMASIKKNNDALNANVEALLTADQKSKFKDMQGKHFEATSQPAGFGRGGG